MEKKIRIGSRESKLAVRQSELIIEELEKYHPKLSFELVTMKTTGDIILHKTLDKIGGKGLFVKELDRALLNGDVDLTVHSLKDMPMQTPSELPILAYSRREDPRDALVLPEGELEWDRARPVGCSSLRRKLQLEVRYPGVQVKWIRGNVQTRLRKLDQGEYGSLVLAAAGLKRLGLEERIHRYFSPEEMIPAAGQGIMAVQGRREMAELTRCLYQETDVKIAEAERAFVRRLDGGCSSPVAAYARIDGEWLILTGLYYHPESGQYLTGEKKVRFRGKSTAEAAELGIRLADELQQKFVEKYTAQAGVRRNE